MRTTRRRLLVLVAASATLAAGTALSAPSALAADGAHLTGVVVAPDGTPVPNVFVTDGNDLGFTGTTDANGRFDFANPNNITSRTYLCAKLAQDAPQGGSAGWFDACGYATPGTAATFTFQPGAAIGGVVTDVKSGQPLAGASVGVFDNNDNSSSSVTTDATGHWTYRNLRPGTLNLVPDSAAKVWSAAPNGYLGVGPERTGVVLRAGQARTDIGIQVAPVVRYSGTVVDASGTAIAGASVAVSTYDAFTVGSTDGSGAWSIRAPWSGRADACAWAGATTAHPTGLAVSCTVLQSAALTVQRGFTLTTAGGALRGSVISSSGATLTSATVVVNVPLASGATLPVPALRKNSTWTASGLPRGTFSAQATAPTTNGPVTGYAKPTAVTTGATATFPTITLSAGN